jgi:hypothetical protein
MAGTRSGGSGRNDRFARNLQYLHEPLKQRILRTDPKETQRRIEIVRPKDGYPVCRYIEGGRAVRITSTDPVAQAETWCGQIPFREIGTLFVYGCGFGYPLLEMMRRKQPETQVLVFEPDLHLFIAMLREFDLAPLFETGKFAFFAGPLPELSKEFARFISQPDLFYLTSPSVAFAPGARLFKQTYIRLHTQLFELLALQTKKFGNDPSDTLLGFHHMADNLDEVLENPYLSCLKNRFDNVPAFVIANGPSLDQAIPELKEAVGKGLILCSESAIAPLMKNGIVPDAVCVLERTEKSYRRHFENKRYPEELALLGLAVIDPRIFRSFPGPKIPVFRSRDSDSLLFNRTVGDGSALFGGKSSAHFAFEAALYMGANPIVLVGQDLAYGPDGSTHSRQSVYAEADQQDTVAMLKAQPAVYVKSNDGRIIRSNAKWNHFKLLFVQMIEQHPQVTVINTTEAGAAIKGTVCAPLADVIRTHCPKPLPHKLHAVIRDSRQTLDIPARQRRVKRLLAELEKYAAIYRALERRTAARQSECERLMRGSVPEPESDRFAELRRFAADNARGVLSDFLHPDLHLTHFQPVLFAGFHKLGELGPIHSPGKFRQAMQAQAELLDGLNALCQSLARNIRIAAGRIRSRGYER